MSFGDDDKTMTLNLNQRVRLVELLREQRASIRSGEISGFGQPVEDEIADIDELIDLVNSPADGE